MYLLNAIVLKKENDLNHKKSGPTAPVKLIKQHQNLFVCLTYKNFSNVFSSSEYPKSSIIASQCVYITPVFETKLYKLLIQNQILGTLIQYFQDTRVALRETLMSTVALWQQVRIISSNVLRAVMLLFLHQTFQKHLI